MRPRVLILSSLYDFSVDIVARALAQMGESYVRLNREQFVDFRLTFDPVNSRMLISGLGLEAEVGPELQAVWYRAPVFLRNAPAKALSPSEQLARSQWSAFLRAMTVFDGARWMNHPTVTYQAECKPFQLKVAAECGFLVPRTIVTNDVRAVRTHFADRVAVKSIDAAYLHDGEEVLFAYTSILGSEELCDENMRQAPLFAQEVLWNKTDLRVTVVGKSLWAYRITVDGRGTSGDWRLKKRDEIRYEQTELPSAIANLCLRLCERLRLPFAAIDLIETDSGIFFVEVNPTGEWAWLPRADERAGAEIAAWLAHGGRVGG